MTSPQYMPLYVGDYLADAAHISTLAHGAYLLLIMNYWQRGKALPANDRVLAGVAKLTPEQWADVKLDLADFFQEIDGCWRHKRIEQELETARDKVAKASAAGKASAEARANARSTDAEQPSNHKIRLDEVREEEEKKLVGQAAQQRQASDTSRGTRLPLDWQATPEMHSYAMDHGVPPEAIERMDTDFREHWIGKPGAGGRKADWTLTYQTWARREGDKHRARQRDPPRQFNRDPYRSPLD